MIYEKRRIVRIIKYYSIYNIDSDGVDVANDVAMELVDATHIWIDKIKYLASSWREFIDWNVVSN